MKRCTFFKHFVASLAVVLVTSMTLVQSQQIHYFNFNEATPTSPASWPGTVNANIGTATLTHDFTSATSFAGSTINANSGDASGGSFVPVSGVANVNNGKFFTLNLPSTKYKNLVLTFSARNTATGFNKVVVEYTADGTTWVEKQVIEDLSTSFKLYTIDFTAIAEVNNNANFAVRFTLSGATAESGNNRYDNFSLAGELMDYVTLFTLDLAQSNIGSSQARGIAVHGNNLYVANRNATANAQVDVYNRLTGVKTGSLNTTNVAGGVFPLNDIEVSDDGVVLLCNLVNAATHTFTIYKLHETNAAEAYITLPLADLGTSRLGDKFTVVGSIADGTAVIYAADAGTGAKRIFKWKMTSGDSGFAFAAPETIPTTAIATNGSAPCVAPLPNGNFYFTGVGTNVYKFNKDGVLLGTVPTAVVGTGSSAIKYVGMDGADEIIEVYIYGGAGFEKTRIVRVPGGNAANAAIEFDTPTIGTANSSGNGDVAFIKSADGKNADLYVISSTNGIGGYTSLKMNLEFPVYPLASALYAVNFTVKNSLDEVLTNAVVTLNGTENEAGNYAFANLAPGTYSYSISAPEHETLTGTVEVVDANVTVPAVITKYFKYDVTFAVNDEANAPYANAVITLDGVTNAAGVYTFTDLLPGTYNYKIEATGFELAEGTVTVVDADQTVTVQLVSTLTRYTVTFDIKEGETAVTNAVVTFNDVTNDAGVYTFADLLPGTYNFVVAANGYLYETGTVEVVDANVTKVVTLTAFVAQPIVLNTLLDKTGTNVPTQIATGGLNRGAALYKNRYVIVPFTLDGLPQVGAWDMHNPHLEPILLSTTNVELGYNVVNYAHVVGDDIYVSNMTLASNAAHPFKVYRWSGLDATPEVVLSTDGNWGRLGDAFSIIGDPATTGSIIGHLNSGGEGQRIFKKWNYEGGVLLNLTAPETLTMDPALNINSFGVLNPVEGEEGKYLTTGNGMGIGLVNLAGELFAQIPSPIVNTKVLDPKVFLFNSKRYLIYGVNNSADTEAGARYDIIDLSFAASTEEAMKKIVNADMLNSLKVASFILGSGSGIFPAVVNVSKTATDLMVMAFATNKGFVVQTTAALPAQFALTVVASPADMGTATGSGNYYEGATVPVKATPAEGFRFVNWTVGTEVVGTDAEFTYTMPAGVTTLTANFEAIPVIEIETLAELRDIPADGNVYLYTGTAYIVAKDGYRNRKYIQDETAAILIDDVNGIITGEYFLYDGITNIEGKINIFRNMVQFIPSEDATKVQANIPVEPKVLAIGEITQDHQAQLLEIENVTFVDLTDAETFASGTNYTVTDGTNEFIVRTDFFSADYIGDAIPTTAVNIAGVLITYNEQMQLVPRMKTDITEYQEPAETFAVTLNVDMTNAAAFNPESDDVFVTGTMFEWAAPGSETATQTMTRVENTMVWTITLQLEAGSYQYKYFINEGWDGGEWAGDPNRTVAVSAAKVVMDFWGNQTNVTTPEMVEVNMFPNPASSYVSINSGAVIRNVEITDLSGKVVYNNVVNDTQVQIHNQLETGIYIVRVYTEESVVVRKLQVQR